MSAPFPCLVLAAVLAGGAFATDAARADDVVPDLEDAEPEATTTTSPGEGGTRQSPRLEPSGEAPDRPGAVQDTRPPFVDRPEESIQRDSRGALVRFAVPGEWQIRLQGQSDIPLSALPGESPQPSLGQQAIVEHWLRVRPFFAYDGGRLRIVGQLDVLNGLLVADQEARGVTGLRPRDEYDGYSNIDPRWLYLEWTSPIGLIRAGQMGSTWGLGLLAHDGDWHREEGDNPHEREPVFGDYRYGDIVERIAFATKPLGLDSDFVIAVAGDLVFRDHLAKLTDGDLAFQAVLAAFWSVDRRFVGVYGVYRNQTQDDDDELEVGVADVFVRWDFPIPSGGFAEVALEAAAIVGSTTLARTLYVERADVRQGAVAAQAGITTSRVDARVEVGWATGDAAVDGSDDAQTRFVMDPDHRVGLLLFPEVLSAMTARAAVQASAPELVGRPFPGSELLPTNGGVAGAFYVNPTVVWRPWQPWWDVRFGAVLAQSSSDLVDPFRQRTEGVARNFRGGDAGARDLGLELDFAARVRVQIARNIRFQARLEGAVLLPGHAFDDEAGEPMDPLVLGRIGLGMLW
ncbi:MAG: hypothetical protein IT379_13845 [Deltaproteobacteria bacterium]|nr:hypothetical protein [Deltaproteobacteria bacterium]